MPFDLGDVVPLSIAVYDAVSVLTNVGTITLTITLPDGTTVTPAVANPPAVVGMYAVDYVTTVAGRHGVRWTSLGPQSAHTDAFDVRPVNPPLLFSLDDGKATLNVTGTTNDEEIRDLIESVTGAVEYIAGPVMRQTVVEKHNGGDTIVLRESPVISVTSIVPVFDGGTSYLPADIDVDGPTGELCRKDSGTFVGPVRVTFIAGRPVTPAGIRDAARIILKHLWRIQNGTAGLPSFDSDGERIDGTTMISGLGFALPNRAIELLQPYARPPKVG